MNAVEDEQRKVWKKSSHLILCLSFLIKTFQQIRSMSWCLQRRSSTPSLRNMMWPMWLLQRIKNRTSQDVVTPGCLRGWIIKDQRRQFCLFKWNRSFITYYNHIICYDHYWPLYSYVCVLEVRVQNLGGQGYLTVDVADLQFVAILAFEVHTVGWSCKICFFNST